jgi:hypothetical protein
MIEHLSWNPSFAITVKTTASSSNILLKAMNFPSGRKAEKAKKLEFCLNID